MWGPVKKAGNVLIFTPNGLPMQRQRIEPTTWVSNLWGDFLWSIFMPIFIFLLRSCRAMSMWNHKEMSLMVWPIFNREKSIRIWFADSEAAKEGLSSKFSQVSAKVKQNFKFRKDVSKNYQLKSDQEWSKYTTKITLFEVFWQLSFELTCKI
jgi:hypothetical protein